MQPIRRIKRSRSTWQEIFARHAGSGLSVLEFCRGEGINPGVFRRWRLVMNGDGKPRRSRPGRWRKRRRRLSISARWMRDALGLRYGLNLAPGWF